MALAAIASAPSIIGGRGGIDLTISPLMYLTARFCRLACTPWAWGLESVPIVLAAGAGIGAANGLIIILLRVPPVVATLAMFFVLLGVDLAIAPIQWAQWELGAALAGSVEPIPGALFTLGFLFSLGASRPNPDSANVLRGRLERHHRVCERRGCRPRTGYRVRARRAVRGCRRPCIDRAGRLRQHQPCRDIHAAWDRIRSLGGTSLYRGRGGLFGAMLGLPAYLLQNLLTMNQIDPSWLQVMYGGMLLLAVP